jgi:hypothetical protein
MECRCMLWYFKSLLPCASRSCLSSSSFGNLTAAHTRLSALTSKGYEIFALGARYREGAYYQRL